MCASRVLAPLVLACALLLLPSAVQAQDDETNEAFFGSWSAEEDYFRPVIHIGRGEGGALAASLGRRALGEGAPFSSVTIRGDSVFFASKRMGARFEGALTSDGSAIEGTWTQGERAAPLTLTPVERSASSGQTAAQEPVRPQEPEPPYPYAAKEVTFQNETGGPALSGTLTLPEGDGPFPVAVLLSGTGANERNYEIDGHALFHVLADRLTRRGVAVLRYDRRGVGRSKGRLQSAHLEDFARDAAAALRFLKSHSQTEAGSVGLVGHSAGGLVAPMASTQSEDAAFLALLMPPAGRPGHEILVGQEARLQAAAGASQAEVDSARVRARRIFDVVRADTDSATTAARLRAVYEARGVKDEDLVARIEPNTMPWFRDLARYDPLPLLREVEAPVFVLFGTKDLMVPPEQHASSVRTALAARSKGDATVRVLDGLNHWMQPAETGRPSEISQIETTVAPALIDELVGWIQSRTAAGE
jgi:pimeloyl-ACP methyl ester carboxylesterase